MAMCEKCQKGGYAPDQMFIEANLFVGPCCCGLGMTPVAAAFRKLAEVHVLPGQPDEVEYGLELTSTKGVHAYVRYGGLDISFERSPKQIQSWAEMNGLVEKKSA